MRYIPEKDKKADIKPVYQANNEQQGYEKLLGFEEKRGKKDPLSCKSWLDNWTNLSAFFEYDQVIRKIIYTTSPIEGVHRQIRKITKTKGAFSSEQALMKLMYLVIKNISKKYVIVSVNSNSNSMVRLGLKTSFGNCIGCNGWRYPRTIVPWWYNLIHKPAPPHSGLPFY